MASQATAIIPAAGFGTRMQETRPKQYLNLAGKPVLVRTVAAFFDSPHITDVIVVVPSDWVQHTIDLLLEYGLEQKPLQVIAGGIRRQDSVQKGLAVVPAASDFVMVHDGARPLVSQQIIDRCYLAAVEHGAAIAALPVKETLKYGKDGGVVKTIDRRALYHAQTPQVMRKDLLCKAFAENGEQTVTDESMLLERAGIEVKLVEGSATNIKITHPEDLLLAEKILAQRRENMHIGHGFDAHRLQEGRKLVLGGVTIPSPFGLAGHSDADVLSHALCDAILGAIGAGDIGRHFPDSDMAYRDVYSIRLLEQVVEKAAQEGYVLGNADLTIVCQAPRLAAYVEEMRLILAKACMVAPRSVNIKATTTEKMGYTGRGEGISCHAVVLMRSGENRQ